MSTFAVLRWRLFRGAVRCGGTERIGAIVSLGLAVVVGLGGGATLAIAGRTTPDPAGLAVAACTLITVAVVAFGIIAGVTQSVDPRVIAAESLDDHRRAAGVLVAAGVGPTGIAGAAICGALVVGMVRTVAESPIVVIGALVWGATLLVVARTATNLLALMLTRSPRLGQIVVGSCGLVLSVGLHIVPSVFVGLDDAERLRLVGIASWTPPGVLGKAIAVSDGAGPGLVRLVVGIVWAALLVAAFLSSERRLAVSVRRAPSTGAGRPGRRSASRLIRRWCGSGPSGTVAWRSLVVRFRQPRTALETVLGASIGLAAALAPAVLDDDPGSGAVLVGGAVQLAVLFMAGNSFGTDGAAVTHEFLTGCSLDDLVDGKRRSIIIVAAPVAVLGPIAAAAITGAWAFLPAGWCVGLAGLLAGTGAAVVQSVTVPIAIPESDNPFASGDSGSGLAAALLLTAVLSALAVITLPVALALFWAVDSGRLGPVVVLSGVTVAIGWATGRFGRRIAIRHLSRREPEFLAALVPAR